MSGSSWPCAKPRKPQKETACCHRVDIFDPCTHSSSSNSSNFLQMLEGFSWMFLLYSAGQGKPFVRSWTPFPRRADAQQHFSLRCCMAETAAAVAAGAATFNWSIWNGSRLCCIVQPVRCCLGRLNVWLSVPYWYISLSAIDHAQKVWEDWIVELTKTQRSI